MDRQPASSRAYPVILERLPLAVGVAGLLIFLAHLAGYAYAGTFSRFWADDYCYTATIKQLGLLPGLLDWYQSSGNRLSTLLPVALTDLFGPGAIQVVPLVVLLLWLASLAFLLARLGRAAGRPLHPLWVLFLPAVYVYYLVLLAPDRLQTVYWRMGVLHYSLPMPFLFLMLALLAGAWRAPRPGPAFHALLAGLAFFAAGLSETYAALQTALCLAAIALLLVLAPAAQKAYARLWVAPLAGSLLMMLVMSQAPANAWRQAVMPPPDNLFDIIPVSLRYAAEFIFYAIRGRPLPFLAYALALFAAGFAAWPALPARPAGAVDRRADVRKALAAILLVLLLAYGLIVASFAPSAYAGLQYPAGRALMPAHAVLLLGLGGAAFLAAGLLQSLLAPERRPALAALAALLLLAASLYPFRALPVYRQDLAQLTVRAERWDARAADIRAAVAAGDLAVRTQQVDVVQGLEDIGPNPEFWINACAAIFFDAASITAAE